MKSTAEMSILFTLFLSASAAAAERVVPRAQDVSTAGLFVPVALDTYAADQADVSFPSPRVTVDGIPFDLVTRPGANNLFLKSAEWPDWKADPSSYYADYDRAPAAPGDARRPMFKVPVADYVAVYLLAATDNDRSLTPVVSLRIGAFDGPRRTTLHDFTANVPRFDEKRGTGASSPLAMAAGSLFVVRVPLGKAMAQDFADEWAFDVEVTKELRLAIRRPDPCRFQIRPLGLPSGVRLFGMTFQRAAVQMRVTSDQVGNVFNQPQTPTFYVRLHNLGRKTTVHVEAAATDFYGQATTVSSPEITLEPMQQATQDIELRLPKRGYYELLVRLLGDKRELLRRETTLALLPADTRRHRDECVLGTWDFGGTHYTPSDPDQVGPLYVKAGLRYGMFAFSAEARRKYGVLAGSEPRSADDLAKRLAADPLHPLNVLIFHEHAVSADHVMRTPDLFTGRSPYQLNAKEQERFDALWKEAHETAAAVRARFPAAQLALGNGNPQLLEEFLRRKFPPALFDSRGNECASFMRMPETQPLDCVANNAGLWIDRQILDHYGYRDKPLTQCYEIMYPNTNPGNLSLGTQAAYLVRHVMHSLVWGIPRIRPACICDVGNSYYYSNWGASGLCFAKPDVRPKPAYVAMATLTQVLDGARLTRAIPTDTATVYALEFRRSEGRYVYVLWTPRGSRTIAIQCAEPAAAQVIDLMGNESRPQPGAGKLSLEIGTLPVFLCTQQPIERLTPGKATLEGPPPGQRFVISRLATMDSWQVEPGRSQELEFYNFDCPRRKGNFQYHVRDEVEGQRQVLSVTPTLPVDGSPYLPMYSVLTHKKGVVIPREPTEIGLLVYGNGGWGRVIFELEDASGQRWTSIGAQRREPTRWMADWMSPAELEAMKNVTTNDWNTNDPWQRSRINFEGWAYIRFPLPGDYSGERYHWPYSSNWKFTGDGVVKYPLTFRKLILELPEHTLYLKDYLPPRRQEICLKDLIVTYLPVEQAMVAP